MPNILERLTGGSEAGEERKGLGYRYIRDPRSDAFLMAPRLVEAPEPPPEREWPLGPTLDQGREGSCVGHGWAAWINAGDVNGGVREHPVDHAYALDIYNWAQNNDEWADTPPAEGTSVLAGAKACVQFKHLKEGYLWGTTTNDLLLWLGNYGPVVMGSLWLSGMNPTANGYITPTGKIVGGHCYLCYGYMQVTSMNPPRVVLKFQNLWGDSWGDGGKFYVYLNEYETLLGRGNYAMCTPLELAPAPPEPTPTPSDNRITVNLSHLAMSPGRYYGKSLQIVERRRSRWNADPI